MTENASQRDAVDRFINAVEQAKTALEGKYRQKFTGLGAAKLHALKHGDRVVKSHAGALDVLIDLRNVIQHNRINGGVPIAIPRHDAVEAMERIGAYIEKQPQIKDFMERKLEVLSPETAIEEASEKVVRLDISQMPVYDADSYIGLFTTNAMARWLGHTVSREDGVLIVENVKVDEILKHVEAHETPHFVKPTQSALKVCESLSKETAPPAILVTTDGSPAGQLQGIVTRFDVARIVHKAIVTYP